MQVLSGHTSAETAYLVADYPYGFRLRCKIRYWIEYKPGHGYRFVSQTTNPKVSGERWNKPKASTYCKLGAALFLDDDKRRVHWSGLTEWSTGPECKAWLSIFEAGVPATGLAYCKRIIAAKVAYDAARQPGDPLHIGIDEACQAMKDA